MKRTWKTVGGVAMALSMLVVSQAFAQQQPGEERDPQQQQQRAEGDKQIVLVSKLNQMTVKDKEDETVGRIQDLVMDQEGKVQYFAVSTTDQAGQQQRQPGQQQRQPGQAGQQRQPGQAGQQRQPGQAGQQRGADMKLTLIPFDAAEIHTGEQEDENYVSLDIEKDRISQAPSFSHQQLSSQQQQQQWMSQVDRFFERETGAARPELKEDEEKKENKEKEDN